MKEKELLGQLRDMTNCLIISDLRYVSAEVLYSAIITLNEDDYTIDEWYDAIRYLTEKNIDKSIGKAAAKEYLCDYYRK